MALGLSGDAADGGELGTDLGGGVLIAGLRHAGVAEQRDKIVGQSCCPG